MFAYNCIKKNLKINQNFTQKLHIKRRKGNRGDRDGTKSSLNVYNYIVLTQESYECFT